MMVGCFEKKSKPRAPETIPRDFYLGQFAKDWNHFDPAMINTIHRKPKLEYAGIQTFLNGPETFRP